MSATLVPPASPAGAAPARKAESRDPATGEVWRSYPAAGAAEFRAAMEIARAAQRTWSAVPIRRRAQALERFRRVLFARRQETANVIMRENGKPAAEALTTEVMVTLDLARMYARRAPHLLADEHFTPANPALMRKRVTLRYEPHGVVGVISPWNYPFMLAAGLVLPAVVAGNAVLFKPSEFSPTSGVLLGELLAAAGLPAGLVQVLTGDGASGAALVECGVEKVFFIGSESTGRKVAHACAERLIPCSLELGGSDPAIILADADLDVAASGILWGRFSNAGQTCIAPKRIFVESAAYDAFLEKLSARVKELHVGPGAAPGSDMGPMIRPSQTAALTRQLDDAVARGASIAAEGSSAGGDFFAPTLLVNATAEMQVLRDETFGPLLPVMRVRDADEAVRAANASTFGLSASVWGRDLARAERVARQLDAGTVTVNDTVVAAGIAEVPIGGVKSSGYGRSHGTLGLLECVRTKAIIVDRISWMRQPWWFGYSAGHAAGLDKFLKLLHGRGLVDRLSGAWASVKLVFTHERPI